MFSPLLQIDIGYMYKICIGFLPLSMKKNRLALWKERGCGEEGHGNREVGDLKANPTVWTEMSQ